MKHQALIELRAILKLPDWAPFCPEKLREEQLDNWISRWIIELEHSQSIVSTKYLDSEYSDLIKLKLAQAQAEDLAEDCISFSTADKKITASMCAIRRRGKE